MPTYLLFACLKNGYKAVAVGNPNLEVFTNGTSFFQIDDYDNSFPFKPENYKETIWQIVYIG